MITSSLLQYNVITSFSDQYTYYIVLLNQQDDRVELYHVHTYKYYLMCGHVHTTENIMKGL